MSPKVTNIHRHEVREKIIQAAVECFSESGFAGTKMEEIARKIDLGKGTIYLYFESKEDLFVAICEYYLDALKKQLSSLFASRNGLLADAETLYDNLRSLEKGNQKVMVEMTVESTHNPRLKRALYEHRMQVNLAVLEYLQNQASRGLVRRDIHMPDLALALVALYNGLTISEMQGVDEELNRSAWIAIISAVMKRI